jgi:uncharacterized protein
MLMKDPSLAQAVVGFIRLAGERVTAAPLPESLIPDPGDLPFAEVAVSSQADYLVSGNARHFAALEKSGIAVQSPAEFLETLTGQTSK